MKQGLLKAGGRTCPSSGMLFVLLIFIISLHPVRAQPASNTTTANGTCVRPVDSSCLSAQSLLLLTISSTNMTALNTTQRLDFLWAGTNQLLSACLGQAVQQSRFMRGLAPKEGEPILAGVLPKFFQTYGYQVNMDYELFDRLNNKILDYLTGQGGALKAAYNVWHYGTADVVDLYDAGAFLDLKPYVLNDFDLKWDDVIPYFRDVTAVYENKVVGLPEAVLLPYFYYRRDIVKQYNISIPVTWEELVQTAAQWNGTVDCDGDGINDWSICLQLQDISGTAPFYYFAILASMTQTHGFSEGFLFDPMTLDSFINTPAGLKALQLYKALYTYSKPELYNAYRSLYLDGKCIFTLRYSDIFKQQQQNRIVNGNNSATLYPGSTQVYNKATGQMVPCTPALCTDVIARPGREPLAVNRAPFSGVAFAAAINPNSNPLLFDAAYKLISASVTPSFVDQFQVLNTFSPVGPMRNRHLDRAVWIALRYAAQDVDDFLAATRAILGHPNSIPDLRIRNSGRIRQAVDQALHQLGPQGADLLSVLSSLDAAIRDLVPNRFSQPDLWEATRASYWAAIKFQAPSPPPPPPPFPPPSPFTSRDNKAKIVAPAVVVPVVVVIALSLATVLLVKTLRKSQHKTLFGKAIAPRGASGTSLVITDIESSTVLWDVLDAAIMDDVLRMHHTAVREVCRTHAGYESATEGDSFILAFHSANTAVLFSVEVQEALMACAWPEPLLQLDLCKPVWVQPIAPRQLTQTYIRKSTTSAAPTQKRTLASFFSAKPSHGTPTDDGMSTLGPMSTLSHMPEAKQGGHGSDKEGVDPETGTSVALSERFSNQTDRSANTTGTTGLRTSGNGTVPSAARSSNPTNRLSTALQSMGSGPANSQQAQAGGMPTGLTVGVTQSHGPGSLLTSASAGPPSSLPNTPQTGTALQGRGHSGTFVVPAGATATQLQLGRASSHGAIPLGGAAPRAGMLASGPNTPNPSAPQLLLPQGLDGAVEGEGATFMVSGAAGRSGVLLDRSSSTGLDGEYRSGQLMSPTLPGRESNEGPGGMSATLVGPKAQHGSESGYYTPSVAHNTVSRHLERSSQLVDAPGPGRLLLFRGLRVRVGVHTGVSDPSSEVVYNRTAGRYQYTGAFALCAKKVQDAAQGGMVLLSESTKEELHLEGKEAVVVAHMGEHELEKEGSAPCHLYCAFREALMYRFGYLGPVRSAVTLSTGFLSAPYGEAAIGFMNVVGFMSLQAYDAELTSACLRIYRELAGEELSRQNGYLVEQSDGLLLVAFPRATQSIRWALCTIKACLEAEWPVELLGHELGEEIGIGGMKPSVSRRYDKGAGGGGTGGAPNPAAGGLFGTLLFRGLRLKCGLDAGKVSASVHAVLGRMTYRGRVMNRAARIAGATKTGQVWCSESCWAASLAEGGRHAAMAAGAGGAGAGGTSITSSFISAISNDSDPHAEQISATPLGPFKLKGVAQDVELVHCHFEHDTLLAGAGRDARVSTSFTVKASSASLTRRANSGNSVRSLLGGRLEEGDEEGDDSETPDGRTSQSSVAATHTLARIPHHGQTPAYMSGGVGGGGTRPGDHNKAASRLGTRVSFAFSRLMSGRSDGPSPSISFLPAGTSASGGVDEAGGQALPPALDAPGGSVSQLFLPLAVTGLGTASFTSKNRDRIRDRQSSAKDGGAAENAHLPHTSSFSLRGLAAKSMTDKDLKGSSKKTNTEGSKAAERLSPSTKPLPARHSHHDTSERRRRFSDTLHKKSGRSREDGEEGQRASILDHPTAAAAGPAKDARPVFKRVQSTPHRRSARDSPGPGSEDDDSQDGHSGPPPGLSHPQLHLPQVPVSQHAPSQESDHPEGSAFQPKAVMAAATAGATLGGSPAGSPSSSAPNSPRPGVLGGSGGPSSPTGAGAVHWVQRRERRRSHLAPRESLESHTLQAAAAASETAAAEEEGGTVGEAHVVVGMKE